MKTRIRRFFHISDDAMDVICCSSMAIFAFAEVWAIIWFFAIVNN